MGYVKHEPGGWGLALRALAIVLLTLVGTSECVVMTLGETFGDPVGERVKFAQGWTFFIAIFAGGALLAYGFKRGGGWAVGAFVAAGCLIVGAPIGVGMLVAAMSS